MLIAFCGQKGGSGKTTTAIAVAGELLARGRYSVLLVDADPQGTTRTWADVAGEHGHPTPTVVAMGSKMHLPGQLDALARGYDFTVIDCPPRHGDIHRSALMITDLAVLPCGPAAVDVWALAESVALIEEARALRPELKSAALITRKVKRTAIGAGAREALGASGLKVLRTELGYRVAYQEAPAAGLGIAQYAPRDAAATEVKNLVDELLEELEYGKETRHRTPSTTQPRGNSASRPVRQRERKTGDRPSGDQASKR